MFELTDNEAIITKSNVKPQMYQNEVSLPKWAEFERYLNPEMAKTMKEVHKT